MRCLSALLMFASVTLTAQQLLIPADLGTAPLTRDASSDRSNTLSYGLTFAGAFDDNAANVATGSTHTNATSSIQPHISLAEKRGRFSSAVSYDPSFTYSNDIASYNSSAQIAGADVEYFVTEHLSAHFRNAFSRTSNPYDSFRATTELPSLSILNGPSDSAMGVNVRNTNEAFQGDVTKQTGRHTFVGVGGTFHKSNYETILGKTSTSDFSLDSQEWSSHGFYSHQWTPRYSGGVQYTLREFSSRSPIGTFSSLSHQVIGFLGIAFTPHIEFSIFAGPQYTYSNAHSLEVIVPIAYKSNRPSLAAGSSLTWQGEHSGITASFLQQVGDSGFNGVGSVLVRTAQLQVQRRVTNRLTLNIFGNYVSNQGLHPQDAVSLENWASAGVAFSRVLTRRLTLGASALRQQFIGNNPTSFVQYFPERSHDVASVSLSYSFEAPIGR
jgi:hypothetical protein